MVRLSYLLRDIPEKLWFDVRVSSFKDHITLRELILRSLRFYLKVKSDEPALSVQQFGLEIDQTEAKEAAKDALGVITKALL